jgi:hypothetical protein
MSLPHTSQQLAETTMAVRVDNNLNTQTYLTVSRRPPSTLLT